MRSETVDNIQVLIALEDTDYAATLERFLDYDQLTLERCHDARGVLRVVGRREVDVVLLDLALAEESDVDLVSFVRERRPRAQVILLFDMVHLERALEGIRHGAYFYLPRSVPPSDVALVVSKALHQRAQETSLRQYEHSAFEHLLGISQGMKRVVELISKVAPTDSTVLLLGESGVGKEVVANAVHRLSHRRDEPFVAINCAALPEALLESEMFGHVKGAFTGASSDKRGLFEEADGGTIFLDEIGDMSLITQAKLLRVLQNGDIRPVGSSTSKRVDVRIVAATNVDLVEAVRRNAFREDLYFRLNVFQIRIPPLRDRLDALPSLVSHFLSRANAQFGKAVQGVDEHAQVLLRQYDYPGNVRELESIIAHAVIMAEDPVIRPRDLPEAVQRGGTGRLALPYAEPDQELPTLEEAEAALIRRAMAHLDGNQTAVSKQLGISRSTLWRKLKQYAIDPETAARGAASGHV